jgi:hypothetical protein
MRDAAFIYVFQLGSWDLFAYSLDKTGANIPHRFGQCWMLRGTLASLAIELDDKRLRDIQRSLTAEGYCLLGHPHLVAH